MLRLSLKSLRQYDESALETFFRLAEANWGRPLTRKVVHTLYNQGVGVQIIQSAIRSGADVSYGLYTARMSRTLPLRWTLGCVSAGGGSHRNIGGFSTADLLVAGTMQHGEFAGISSTWVVTAGKGSGDYHLGLYLNDLFLSYRTAADSESPQRLAR